MDRTMVSSLLALKLLVCCISVAFLAPQAFATDSSVNNTTPPLVKGSINMTTTGTTAGKTYVFVHGSFVGAWSWYKVATMMEEVNFNTVLLDLPSGGVDRTRPEDVMTIANYSKPLTDYLASINFTVLLVGHDLGGAAVSYAMEMYPDKIEKAIFIQAVMPKDGETPGLLINGQLATLAAQDVLIYNFNNKGKATSISINTTVADRYLFNKTPLEYKILAMKLLTDSPYSILNEVMHLTKENYGSVKRFYITTNMDRFFPSEVQKHIYTQNPPKAKFVLKNGDHASFFSEAPYLFNMLRTIANSQW